MDPITARILSAHHRRRAQVTNHAGEVRHQNDKLQHELKEPFYIIIPERKSNFAVAATNSDSFFKKTKLFVLA